MSSDGSCSGVGWHHRGILPLTPGRRSQAIPVPEEAVTIQLTERMTLTRTNWPDVDDVVALNADTEVMPSLDHGGPMTGARVLAEEMPRLMAHNRRRDRLGSWVARDRKTGDFLGWFMITPVDEPLRTVELTYRLRRKACGQGYDIEGTLRMIEIARAAHVSTVIATMVDADVASRRLMEEAGCTSSRRQSTKRQDRPPLPRAMRSTTHST